jgi:hypothetical protein
MRREVWRGEMGEGRGEMGEGNLSVQFSFHTMTKKMIPAHTKCSIMPILNQILLIEGLRRLFKLKSAILYYYLPSTVIHQLEALFSNPGILICFDSDNHLTFCGKELILALHPDTPDTPACVVYRAACVALFDDLMKIIDGEDPHVKACFLMDIDVIVRSPDFDEVLYIHSIHKDDVMSDYMRWWMLFISGE